MTTVAVLGGSFSPMGKHQLACITELANHFDEVLVFPSGPKRRDGNKASNDYIPPRHRATLIHLAVQTLPQEIRKKVVVDLSDLERPAFTPTWKMKELLRYTIYKKYNVEFWFAVGMDWFGEEAGEPKIKTWEQADTIWQNLNFVILTRPGYTACKLPPKNKVITLSAIGSSTEIRKRIREGEFFDDLVPEKVAAYIRRFKLYTNQQIPSKTSFQIVNPRVSLWYDRKNSKAKDLFEILEKSLGNRNVGYYDKPDMAVVISGDGFMVEAMKEIAELRVPVLGVNAGNRGFLMNDFYDGVTSDCLSQPFDLYESPLLQVKLESSNGHTTTQNVVNDAWLERSAGQMAWFRVLLDNEEVCDCLPADSMLITTPTGSTAYWRNMGGPVFRVGSNQLGLCAGHPDTDFHFRPMLIDDTSSIVLENVGEETKRPTQGCADNTTIPGSVRLSAQMSLLDHYQTLHLPGSREKKVRQMQSPLKRG